MKITTEYLKDTHFIRGLSVDEWEEIPSSWVDFTGRYKTVNGRMFVEIGEERSVRMSILEFISRKKPRTYIHTRWIPEYCIRFIETEIFHCAGCGP